MIRQTGFVLVMSMVIAGCSNALIKRQTNELPEDVESTARQINSLAKTCWQGDESILRAPIIVENVVTLDAIVVSTRFDMFPYGVQEPFMKFVVSESENGAQVEVYTQELPWIRCYQHLHDARNWASGKFTCSDRDKIPPNEECQY